MPANARRTKAHPRGTERMVRAHEDEAPELSAPRVVRITVWEDREPELDAGGLAEWLVDATLDRIILPRNPPALDEEDE